MLTETTREQIDKLDNERPFQVVVIRTPSEEMVNGMCYSKENLIKLLEMLNIK